MVPTVRLVNLFPSTRRSVISGYIETSSVVSCAFDSHSCVNGAVGAKDSDDKLLFHEAYRDCNCVAFDRSIDDKFCPATYTLLRFGLSEKSIAVTNALLYIARLNCSSSGFPLRSTADI